MSRRCRLLLCAAALLAAPPAARAGDPSQHWHTVESAHFVVHYYDPLGDIGRRVAVVAERAHRILAPALRHHPAEKTHIVITDDTDAANGFASVLPRNTIRLYASPPEAASSLNDYDDWLYGLVAHEYSHILHLDTIGGLPAFYNRIFGKTWAPNQIQPRWIIEGIATYEESKRSSSGRTRSALFDMYLRVPVLAGKELGLDAVSNGPRVFPRGNAAYLYGSHFLKYVFDRYGDDKLAEMSHAYGSTPVPFGINQSIRTVTGRTFEQLYDEWREYMRARYRMKLEAIERQGRREGRRLTFTGDTNTNPRFTRDGLQIIWLQADGYSRARFRALPAGGDAAQAVDYAAIDRVRAYDVLADGSLLVEQTTTYKTEYDYQDLYLWDRATRTLHRLTFGLRAREPAVSPDDRSVAFSLTGQSRSRLAVMPLQSEAPYRVLWSGGRYDQVSAPAWSPDGRQLAFAVWRAGGSRDILVADVESGAVTEVTHDRALDGDPVYSPDGAYLYYTSDRNGIYNVYAYERATGATWQVTNVIGCALLPSVSPDGRRLVYEGFDVDGFELYEIELDRGRWLEPELYVNDRPDPTVVPDGEAAVSSPRDYSPLETLAPHAYKLSLSADSFGQAIALQTSGSDVAGRHGYSLAATIGLARGDIGLGGAYAYRRLWPTLRVAAARRVSRPSGFYIDGVNTRYVEETYGFTGSVDLPVLRLANGAATLSLEYDADWLRDLEDQFAGYDPNAAVPRFPETDVVAAGAAVRWRYSDIRSYNYTVGPQEGQILSASLRLNHPGLGSDFHSLELSYRWEGYYKLPWGETPVLSLRVAGGITTTDRRRAGGFVLGGVPEQDIPSAILDSARSGGTGYLRGYRPRAVSGSQFHLANLEYRQLLFEIERGPSTLPIYLRRLHAAALLDAGNAFDGPFDPGEFKVAVGASLRLDLILGYYEPGSLDLGWARGLTADGENELWLLLTGSL